MNPFRSSKELVRFSRRLVKTFKLNPSDPVLLDAVNKALKGSDDD